VVVVILKLLGQSLRPRNISGLRGFIAATKDDDQDVAATNELDAIPRPELDPGFADAFADRFHIAQFAQLKSGETGKDDLHGRPIP
jgi:hypothetical protein